MLSTLSLKMMRCQFFTNFIPIWADAPIEEWLDITTYFNSFGIKCQQTRKHYVLSQLEDIVYLTKSKLMAIAFRSKNKTQMLWSLSEGLSITQKKFNTKLNNQNIN